MTEFELFVKAITKRHMRENGISHADAQAFTIGYLTAFVNTNLIGRAKPAEKERMKKEILERIDTIMR
jgi:hypothetical protein